MTEMKKKSTSETINEIIMELLPEKQAAARIHAMAVKRLQFEIASLNILSEKEIGQFEQLLFKGINLYTKNKLSSTKRRAVARAYKNSEADKSQNTGE